MTTFKKVVVFSEMYYQPPEDDHIVGVQMMGVYPDTSQGKAKAYNRAYQQAAMIARRYDAEIKVHGKDTYECRIWLEKPKKPDFFDKFVWVVRLVDYIK